jgi:hypothetical protein
VVITAIYGWPHPMTIADVGGIGKLAATVATTPLSPHWTKTGTVPVLYTLTFCPWLGLTLERPLVAVAATVIEAPLGVKPISAA